MTGPLREMGAMCVNCMIRPAVAWPSKADRAGLYCSAGCKDRACQRRIREKKADEANAIRDLFGLPGGRGPAFSLPELRAMRRRLRRIAPAGGMSRYPATTRKGAA